jgi:hypothetical protein
MFKFRHSGFLPAAVFFPLAVYAQTFQASSTDVDPSQPIGQKFVYNGSGCKGQNMSPALSWSNAPAGAKSFAVTVHDPDAPTGGAGFWHWIVVNIPASSSSLEQGAGSADGKKLPAGSRQLANDFGKPSWSGPCPPAGDKPHRYNFTVYALKEARLDFPPNAKASSAAFMIEKNALGKAGFTARYGR